MINPTRAVAERTAPGHGSTPELGALISLWALLMLMPGCAAGPDPTDREPNAADAYIHSVEQQARNAVSPTQVIWAHPPSGDDTAAGGTRTWNWSAPVRAAEPPAARDEDEFGNADSGMHDDAKDPGGLPRDR